MGSIDNLSRVRRLPLLSSGNWGLLLREQVYGMGASLRLFEREKN